MGWTSSVHINRREMHEKLDFQTLWKEITWEAKT